MSKNKLKYESINLIENTDIYIRNKFKKKDLLINLYDNLVKKKCYESAEVLAKYILDIHPNLIEIEYKLCLLQAKRGFVNSSVDRLNRFQKHGINNKSKSSIFAKLKNQGKNIPVNNLKKNKLYCFCIK